MRTTSLQGISPASSTEIRVDDHSYIVIVTRGHRCDEIVLEQAVRTDARYIGMIGSRQKTRILLQKLADQGHPQGVARQGLRAHRSLDRGGHGGRDRPEHRRRAGQSQTPG